MSWRGLGKDYGARTAVGAVDLDLPAGQIIGLLGPNGAGKTTTLSMACGVLPPSRGQVLIDGIDLAREPKKAKARLGLVPQELAIYTELDAVQNLAYFGALHGLSGAELRRRIDWALELAGLTDRARELTARYSGGMKRRLNLAAGLVHQPRVLMLDEPTVGVDPQSRNHVFEAVRELARAGMAIVYTSHYMEEVEQLCDQIAIMDGGEIIARGTVRELTAAHAEGWLELELGGAALELATVLAATASLARLTPDQQRPHVVRCDAPRELAPLLAAVESTGARLLRVTSYQQNLETVFLRLTGKALRDSQERP